MENPPFKQHVQALADYMPNGRLFEAKNIQDSNFRQLLRGLAGELFDAQGYLVTLNNEYLPDLTTLFLDEWERALGIPDCCFPGDRTVTERRRDLLVKLASLGVQTAEDFEALAAVFGLVVDVIPGSFGGIFPLEFPLPLYATSSDARYTIVVEVTQPLESRFPFDFPIIFGTSEFAIIRCVFERLKPTNCNIIFKQV